MAAKLFRRIFSCFPLHQKKSETEPIAVLEESPTELFDVTEILGEGGFGIVAKGRFKGQDKDLAIKVTELKKDQEDKALEEVRLLKRYSGHKNTVTCHCAMIYTKESLLWTVMDYCGGGSLYDLIRSTEHHSLPEHWIQYISREILKGLKYLHKNNLIHQDIKARNIMLTEKAEVKIIDFGLATQLNSPTEKARGAKGTPCFIAPEVALTTQENHPGYGVECDIWSFGITAIQMAEGSAPLSNIPRKAVLHHITQKQPPTLQAEKWSCDFRKFLLLSLVKDPDYRATAEELLRHKFIKRQPRKKYVRREIMKHMAICKLLQDDIEEDDSSSSIDPPQLVEVEKPKKPETPEEQHSLMPSQLSAEISGFEESSIKLEPEDIAEKEEKLDVDRLKEHVNTSESLIVFTASSAVSEPHETEKQEEQFHETITHQSEAPALCPVENQRRETGLSRRLNEELFIPIILLIIYFIGWFLKILVRNRRNPS